MDKDTLLQLHRTGFKLVPLGDDGLPAMRWSTIYDDGWSETGIAFHHEQFRGVATCFGLTEKQDVDGKPLYLNCLDIDSKTVYEILSNLTDNGNNYSLIKYAMDVTYVVKTRKQHGFHIYWLSRSKNKPISEQDCKEGCEFGLKTDKSSGLATLPPSAHRSDPDFHYLSYGQKDLAMMPTMYRIVRSLLKDCLKSKKKAIRIQPYTVKQARSTLDDNAVLGVVQAVQQAYTVGNRNHIALHLAGYLHHRLIQYESAKRVFEILAKTDEERKSRMITLIATYKKPQAKVSGYQALFEDIGKEGMDAIERAIAA